MCASAQFAYANDHLHSLHDSRLKDFANVTFTEPKRKEEAERVAEQYQELFTHSNYGIVFLPQSNNKCKSYFLCYSSYEIRC